MNISIKNNKDSELKVKNILESLLLKYKLPEFTKEIMIEEKSICHSHPVLTLNTRNIEPLFILKVYIHEQFHWFTVNEQKHTDCINYLKKYEDLGDCNKSGKYKDSFYEHLIVCWNTRNFLKTIFDTDIVDFIYTDWQPYPLTEKFVYDNFETLRKDFENFNMIYKQS